MPRYPGNKSPESLYPKIINSFPAHRVYWELFAGSAQILRKKKPAQINVVCELSAELARVENNTYPAGTVVLNSCAISLLDDLRYLGKDHLIYLDPPYIIGERLAQSKMYRHELTEDQHRELLAKLLLCKCNVAISHYPCSMYDDALLTQGWRRMDMKVSYHGNVVTESLYMNYAPAVKLHETTFVGKNKTDRQRIKRKAASWVKMLNKMPVEERQAVLEMINSSFG